MQTIWEDLISLNSRASLGGTTLPDAQSFIGQRNGEVQWNEEIFPAAEALNRDNFVLPNTEDREGYYGQNHFNYWASGLRDLSQILEFTQGRGLHLNSVLDIGCASGRLLRHMRLQQGASEVVGCDINRLHVDWCARHLPAGIKVFQNTAVPNLPLADASFDFVSAFSVFTHVEAFDTTWLMEISRILRPGGIAWITVHSNRTWRSLRPTWPLYAALDTHPDYAAARVHAELPQERLVFRWHANKSYTANIFYSEAYLYQTWARIMPIVAMFPTRPEYQEIVVLQKPAA